MNNYFDRPDGEYFADSAPQPIASADTWNSLSINQLIEVKNTLTSCAFQHQNHAGIIKHLHAAIARLDALIAKRLESS